jgi:hypothetical protein
MSNVRNVYNVQSVNRYMSNVRNVYNMQSVNVQQEKVIYY